MTVIKLYGRDRELSLLRSLKDPFLAVVYGRRRIGKTALVTAFLEERGGLYFFVNPKKPSKALLSEYGEALKKHAGLPRYVKFDTWEDFFDALFTLRGWLVAFDEFQWFMETAPEVPYILQKMWDTRREKPSVIITGSVVGMVKRLVAESGAPLFGRADLVIELGELEPGDVFKWLGDLGIEGEEAFKLFLLFGGVPYYYRLVETWGVKTAEEAVEKLVTGVGAPLRHEVENVLAESLGREYKTHLAILEAVADGATKLEQMAARAGVKATSLPPYIHDLVDTLGLLARQRSRRTYYVLRDRFFAYWLRAVHRHRDTTPEEKLGEKALEELPAFLQWAFEAAVRELIPKLYPVARATKAVYYVRLGGARIQREVDALAVNEERKFAVVAEAKWAEVNPREVLPQLEEAARHLIPPGWEVKYAIFARRIRGDAPADLYDVETLIQKLCR
ncbi:ATP-binding protein [Pyrobaculum aerophilum]|nr:ATP-binding protein [Pyrobaculum aerophilum]